MIRINKRQNWNAAGKWTNTLYVNFNDDKLKLNANDANYTNDNYSLPVAFHGVSNFYASDPTSKHFANFLEHFF